MHVDIQIFKYAECHIPVYTLIDHSNGFSPDFGWKLVSYQLNCRAPGRKVTYMTSCDEPLDMSHAYVLPVPTTRAWIRENLMNCLCLIHWLASSVAKCCFTSSHDFHIWQWSHVRQTRFLYFLCIPTPPFGFGEGFWSSNLVALEVSWSSCLCSHLIQ